MEFRLLITMDTKEMRHPRNVARALERLAATLETRFGVVDESEEAHGLVRNVAGAIVGRWELRR